MKKIVCLGGGIGTVNLLKGIKQLTTNITVVVSVADEGGSGGRIRRFYQMHPPGDVISCLSALAKDQEAAKLLTYRLPGDRYGEDHVLPGHKVGNIMLAAASQMTGSFDKGIDLLKKIFQVSAEIYPASKESVRISARTIEGTMVEGEEALDLGKYEGKKVLDHVFIHPENPGVDERIIQAMHDADTIIAGPGDLYTTILPVLIIPQIKQALIDSKAKKIFIVNVANKLFETKDYKIADFVHAIQKHMGAFAFDTVLVNNNIALPIPQEHQEQYSYVPLSENNTNMSGYNLVQADLVDASFPLYHDKEKLAKVVAETI